MFIHRPTPRFQASHYRILAGAVWVACLVVAGTAWCLPTALSQMPHYFMRVWQTQDGLPHNAVTAVLQTRDGYLWLGSYYGLTRFDGATFRLFDENNTPELKNSRVVSLFEDPAGILWIGHETGELTRYEKGAFHSVDFNPGWESRRILDIGADRSGQVWMLNGEGRLARTTGKVVSATNAGAGNAVVTMARSSRGAIWISCSGSVFELRGGELIPLPGTGSTGTGFATGICAGRDGGLWVMTAGGTRKWTGEGWLEQMGPSPWEPGSITHAIETRSGLLAVGTLERGLYLVSTNGEVLHFSRENGMPHDWVRRLWEDREGTLWAGTGSGGLVALRSGKVQTVNPPDHWQERVVLSVCAATNGALWIGTEGAGLYRLHNDQWTHFDESSGLSNMFVWSVSTDIRGRIWAGTWGGGIFVQNGERFERPPGLEGITTPMLAQLHASDGVTWIGTGSGLLRYENGNTSWFGRREGLVLADVRCVVEDREGGVWFGMLGGGLGHLKDGVLKQILKKDGLPNEYVQCLHTDGEGTLWIGMYGAGLGRLKNGTFTSINTSHGLPNNFISDIEEDSQGNFWLSSHGGIFRVAKEELNRCADGKLSAVSPLSYGKGDGMPTLECSGGLQPAGCSAADGRLWFPTSKGLVAVNPADAKVNLLPPPVVIEQLVVDSRPVSLQQAEAAPLRIPPGRQRFEFRYSGLSFISPEKVRFKYQLEGLEPDWMDAGRERAVNYSYLAPGNYTFRVLACNSDGVWNETGASLSFIVQPHFWQVWWFRVLAGLAGAAVLVGSVLVATRRRMRRKLERLQRQRAIERERSRIAQDIHDNLGASLTRITMLSQSADGAVENPQHAAAQLDRIYTTARELTRAMDEIVWAVNPQHDTLDSLASYLGKFAQDFLVPLNIRCRLDMPVQLPPWPVTAEVRHNLFLAFKEALNNVVKHAAASEVTVSLETGHDVFTLGVRDNGKGFNLDSANRQSENGGARTRGNGLVNMQRRLERIGGRCEIQSAQGKGTEVKFAVSVRVQPMQEAS